MMGILIALTVWQTPASLKILYKSFTWHVLTGCKAAHTLPEKSTGLVLDVAAHYLSGYFSREPNLFLHKSSLSKLELKREDSLGPFSPFLFSNVS